MKLSCLKILFTSTVCLTLGCTSPKPVGDQYEAIDNFDRLDIYSPYTLKSDLSHLSNNQKIMVGLLIDAAKIMDDLFWKVSFHGDKDTFLSKIDDPKLRKFSELNYGPWDRLDGDKVFLKGFQKKPKGAQFYPADITKEEFEKFDNKDKKGLYSILKRDSKGQLTVVPYSKAFPREIQKAAHLLSQAADYAKNTQFKFYLKERAKALLSDQYRPSDLLWMDMKTNPIDVVIGPIETYEDQLYGYRAAFEGYVLIKDMEWSQRLAKYAKFLPELQRGLPVEQKYKKEVPGSDADLNAYDVVYYAGRSNAGAKTIAINLPNDEYVQLKKGTRRLQLKNIMRAKFEKILIPIAKQLIAPDQLKYITFDAFFANTMFHEVSHGLGIKETINGRGPVRTALKELSSPIEEGKADTLGLYMITKLFEKNEMPSGTVENNYATAMAGVFRSIRFGASSAHGRADMVRFNFFRKMGAFTRDEKGYYRVNFKNMKKAIQELSKVILTIQGDGDYERLAQLLKESGTIGPDLASDLQKLKSANIPVDIEVLQGKAILGL
ncbi:MAG: Zn-dependent hydrolase [Pseudomonadota bacterium]